MLSTKWVTFEGNPRAHGDGIMIRIRWHAHLGEAQASGVTMVIVRTFRIGIGLRLLDLSKKICQAGGIYTYPYHETWWVPDVRTKKNFALCTSVLYFGHEGTPTPRTCPLDRYRESMWSKYPSPPLNGKHGNTLTTRCNWQHDTRNRYARQRLRAVKNLSTWSLSHYWLSWIMNHHMRFKIL